MSAELDVDLFVYEKFFPKQTGIMVEIGAAGPDYLSMGTFFLDKRWRVISVEPNPRFVEKHRLLNHEIHQFACSDRNEDGVDFVIATSKYGTEECYSSLGLRGRYKEDFHEEWFTTRKIKVDCRTLDTILIDASVDHIDLLCVDTEGWELEVLRGFSFGALSPKVAIIENLFGNREYHEFMEARGYDLFRSLPPNDVYVKR